MDQYPSVPSEGEVPREIRARIPKRTTQALILTGVRRSGKSVLQAQLLRGRKDALYCNLEDTRLYGFSAEDFPTFLALVPELASRNAAVFLDEVQEVAGWQRLARSLLDRGHHLCLTGSNASLLGRELGSLLTGRHLSFEVFPFSYAEYLVATHSRPDARSLGAYLDDGGFPDFVREREPQILQQLLRDIIQRDITVRYRLRETRHLMNLALFLMANTGQALSLQGLTKGLQIPSVAQTSRYVGYLEDAYVLFPVAKHSPSFRRRVVAPRKYYAVDNGLRRAVAVQTTQDLGHRLENAVFLSLRRRGTDAAYAGEKDSWECDFVTDREAIQVTADLTDYNKAREIRGLLMACSLPGRRDALIITLNQRDRFSVNGRKIKVVPAWEWLLDVHR